MSCDAGYDSHDWLSVGTVRACARCGLIDYEGTRLLRRVIDTLLGGH